MCATRLPTPDTSGSRGRGYKESSPRRIRSSSADESLFPESSPSRDQACHPSSIANLRGDRVSRQQHGADVLQEYLHRSSSDRKVCPPSGGLYRLMKVRYSIPSCHPSL